MAVAFLSAQRSKDPNSQVCSENQNGGGEGRGRRRRGIVNIVIYTLNSMRLEQHSVLYRSTCACRLELVLSIQRRKLLELATMGCQIDAVMMNCHGNEKQTTSSIQNTLMVRLLILPNLRTM